MRIQHKGAWINVDEQPANPWDVQQRQKSGEVGTNLFSPHLSDASSREKALELLPSIEKAAADKARPRHERVKLLRTLSTFQKTAYLVEEQLESAKKVLKYSKAAPDWHQLGISYSFAGKTKEACECFIRAGELPHRNDAYIHQDYQRALMQQLRWKDVAKHYHANADKTGVYDPSGMFKHWEGEACDRAAILATGGLGDLIFWARFIPPSEKPGLRRTSRNPTTENYFGSCMQGLSRRSLRFSETPGPFPPKLLINREGKRAARHYESAALTAELRAPRRITS